MGYGGVSFTPCANFYRPVKELEYTDLLRRTFTQSDSRKGIRNLSDSGNSPSVCFLFQKVSVGRVRWNVKDPTITKATTDKERLVSECAESPTTRCPNRTRFETQVTGVHQWSTDRIVLQDKTTSISSSVRQIPGVWKYPAPEILWSDVDPVRAHIHVAGSRGER